MSSCCFRKYTPLNTGKAVAVNTEYKKITITNIIDFIFIVFDYIYIFAHTHIL